MKNQRKFRRKFHKFKFSTRTLHNLFNKVRTTAMLINSELKCQLLVLTEEKLDEIRVWLQSLHVSLNALYTKIDYQKGP
jgi:hypothetical protein